MVACPNVCDFHVDSAELLGLISLPKLLWCEFPKVGRNCFRCRWTEGIMCPTAVAPASKRTQTEWAVLRR